jgi:hypothetical protein
VSSFYAFKMRECSAGGVAEVKLFLTSTHRPENQHSYCDYLNPYDRNLLNLKAQDLSLHFHL